MNVRQQRSWLARNWPWVVPSGCLLVIVLFASAVLAIVIIAFSLMRSTDVYQQALALARGNPLVIEQLGSPLEPGWLVSSSIHSSDDRGRAEISLPLTGPRGDATLYVEAARRAGRWEFRVLVLELESDGRRFDLLESELPPEAETEAPLLERE